MDERPRLVAASTMPRVLGAVFDLGFLLSSYLLFWFVLLHYASPRPELMSLGLLAWFAAYDAALTALMGATFGMRLSGVRAIAVETGERPEAWRALARTTLTFASAGALGLGFVWILIDPLGRGWHDRFSGCAVVVDDQESSARSRRAGRWLLLVPPAFAGFALLARLVWTADAEMQVRQAARDGLAVVSGLQELHWRETGTYATELEDLVRHAERPGSTYEALRFAFRADTFRVHAKPGVGYRLWARAHDGPGTWISVQGPRRRR